jgi:rubrerythrin
MEIMDRIDPQKVARVWQRVQTDMPVQNPTQGLLELIAHEWTDAATYLQLSRRFQGKDSVLLRKMAQQEQSHCACLKGIYTLITGTPPVVRAVPPAQENTQAILRRCYGREMQCLARYEEKASDPEYGQVYSRLADQEREHCRLILELLGNLKNKRP